MQKLIKYLLLTLLLFLVAVPVVHGQEHKIHGKVVNDLKEPIKGVQITVNESKPVFSDAQGSFECVFTGEFSKISKVTAVKRGYDTKTGQLKWWTPEGDGDFLFIQLQKTPSFYGQVFDDNGEPVSRISVRLTGDINPPGVYTKADGSFNFELHASEKVSENTVFILDGKTVAAKDKKLDLKDDFVKLIYHRPQKNNPVGDEGSKSDSITKGDAGKIGKDDNDDPALKSSTKTGAIYDVLLMDGTEYPLAFLTMVINGKEYKSDARGNFTVRGPLPAKDKFVPMQGYEIVQMDINDKVKSIHIQVQEALQEPLDTLNTGDDVVKEYKEEMNRIIKGLQQERVVLTVKAIELRKQIARLADRLETERELTPQKREELGNTLLRLEQTLEQNDEAYLRAQEKTREALSKLKRMLETSEAEKAQITDAARKERLVLLALLLGVAGIAFAFYVIGRKVKKQREELIVVKGDLEEKVEEIKQKNDRILAQTDKLKVLNHSITAKNQKITDSIFYAKSIQEAILPTQAVMNESLTDYFILYEPKEIVSGDFYWFSQVEAESKAKKIVVAAVDCTGHGVPGGFMSMIGNTLLNEIVNQKKVYETPKVLNYLNNGIKAALKQDEKLNADGMDVCLCAIEEVADGIRVEFSGARRPLFYMNNETAEVGYLKGSPQAIGGMKQKIQTYHGQEVTLKKGDIIYLTSDGLMAQGDATIGKIGTNGFKKFIEANSSKPLYEQKEALEDLLKEYQSEEAQRDDILVFAIKL